MNSFKDFILNHEEWLMIRILEYAQKHEFTKYTSTLAEAWRLSISGISHSIIQAAEHYQLSIPELHPDEKYAEDPMCKFGIDEAKKHRERGVGLSMFLGLMKYYKQTYLDLISEKSKPSNVNQYKLFRGQ